MYQRNGSAQFSLRKFVRSYLLFCFFLLTPLTAACQVRELLTFSAQPVSAQTMVAGSQNVIFGPIPYWRYRSSAMTFYVPNHYIAGFSLRELVQDAIERINRNTSNLRLSYAATSSVPDSLLSYVNGINEIYVRDAGTEAKIEEMFTAHDSPSVAYATTIPENILTWDRIGQCDVVIRPDSWQTPLAGTEDYLRETLVSLLLHEIGHCLGLFHYSLIYNHMGENWTHAYQSGGLERPYLGELELFLLETAYGERPAGSRIQDLSVVNWKWDEENSPAQQPTDLLGLLTEGYSQHERTDFYRLVDGNFVEVPYGAKFSPGEILGAEFTYENLGNDPNLGSRIDYYLSRDNKLDISSDRWVYAIVTPFMDDGIPNTYIAPVPIPQVISAGWYVVIANVNERRDAPANETSWENNTATSSMSVYIDAADAPPAPAPFDLTSVEYYPESDTLMVRWSSSAAHLFYNLKIASQSGCTGTIYSNFSRSATSSWYGISNVSAIIPAAQTVYICLSAINSYGTRAAENSPHAFSLQGAPRVPEVFSIAADRVSAASLDISLTWLVSRSDLVSHYLVAIGAGATGPAPYCPGGLQTATTSTILTSLAGNTNYQVRVCAVDRGGVASIGKTTTFRTAPGTPTGLQASDGTYTDRVSVSWSSAGSDLIYVLLRSGQGTSPILLGTSCSVLLPLPGCNISGNTYVDLNVTPGNRYTYQLMAYNGDWSPLGAVNEGWPALPPPAAVDATDGTYSDRVRLSWQGVSGAISYQLYRSNINESCTTPIPSTTGLTFYDTNISKSVTYYYSVRAIDRFSGPGACSVVNSGYAGPPPAPLSLNATDGIYVDKIAVTWETVPGAASYRLYRSSDSRACSANKGYSTTTRNSYNDTRAIPGVLYYYGVKAVHSNGSLGVCSNVDRGYRKLRPPGTVSATEDTYSDRVAVTWSSVSGAVDYILYRSESNAACASRLGREAITTTSYNDFSAVPGQPYYYSVRSRGKNGSLSDCSPIDYGRRRR